MAVFELILCIIAAVVVSSFVSRFVPKVSTPLVQIVLGVLVTYLPFFPDATLDPELFMVLFIAPLLYLEAQDPDKDISLYINSPRGSISAGMAIHDTIQYIKCDVSTICMGMAASMGAFLLASGTKGKRFALPNAEIMIHQPLIAGGQGGGLSGQATDIKSHADHIIRTRAKMNRLLSEYTGQPLEKVEQDTERDNFLSAQEAKEYGLIDEVITHR